jgi:hypothetical protein
MPKYVKQDYFSDPNKFYRVIRGDEAFKDIQKSGAVRSAAAAGVKYDPIDPSRNIDLGNRPTAWPSFAKGEVNSSYAKGDPKHYIIETKEKMVPSSREIRTGRHGTGSTYFPPLDTKKNRPQTSLPASSVQVWKHIGEGKYEQVRPVRPSIPSIIKGGLTSQKGAGLIALLGSAEQAAKEGKSVYRLFGGGWDYADGKSPKEKNIIKEDWDRLQKENPKYFSELQRLQEARQMPQISVNSPAPPQPSRFNLPYQISNLLKFK